MKIKSSVKSGKHGFWYVVIMPSIETTEILT